MASDSVEQSKWQIMGVMEEDRYAGYEVRANREPLLYLHPDGAGRMNNPHRYSTQPEAQAAIQEWRERQALDALDDGWEHWGTTDSPMVVRFRDGREEYLQADLTVSSVPHCFKGKAASMEAIAQWMRMQRGADGDAELATMASIVRLIEPLDQDAKQRVLHWAYDRYVMEGED